MLGLGCYDSWLRTGRCALFCSPTPLHKSNLQSSGQPACPPSIPACRSAVLVRVSATDHIILLLLSSAWRLRRQALPPSCAATYLPGRRCRPRSPNQPSWLLAPSHPFGIVARNEKGAVHTDGDKTVTKEKPQEKSGRQKSSRQTPPSKCRRELIFLESKPCLNSCSNSSRTRSIFLATLAKEAGFGRVCIV